MNKKKNLIIILIIIVIGVITGIFLYNKNLNKSKSGKTEVITATRPDELKNIEMTTYKSPYRYEITYPNNWISIKSPKESIPNLLENYAIYPKEIPYGPAPLFQIEIFKKTFEEYLEEFKISINDLTEIKLKETIGYKHYFKTIDSSSAAYIFPKKENIIRIIYNFNDNYEISEQTAVWVLSTFKITE